MNKVTNSFFNMLLYILAGVLLTSTCSASNMKNNKCCEYWQSKVDTEVMLSDEHIEIDENDPNVVLNAIECLLKLEGNKNKARFSGATKFEVSQTFEPATVEVASLYYISFLYYQKWDHADAIALVDKNGDINGDKAIQQAYESYRKWYKVVEKIGLQKAKEQNLKPLADSDIRWY